MRYGAVTTITRASLLCVVLLSQVCTVAAQASTPEPANPAPPAAQTPQAVPAAPPGEAAPVPQAPRNYAVPPPPPAAPPRYPAAPDLAPAQGEMSETEHATLQLRIPARIATRLRVLSTDLNTLAARGGGGIADGIFSVVTGGVLITLGVVFQSDDQLNFLSPQLYVFGGTSIARGLIDLIVVPNPYNMMLEFSHLPMTSVDEVKTRLRFGEGALEELSDRSRLARLLDGAVSLGAGATLVGLTLSVGSGNDSMGADNRSIVMVMGLLGAATLAIGGVISLLSASDAERRWEAYQGLRDRLSREHAQQRVTASRTWAPRANAVITPQLVMGTLTVTL